MKQLTLLLLILGSSLVLLAQSKPLYIADTSVSPFNTAPKPGYIPFSALVNVTQCIYYHSDFPGMPIQGQRSYPKRALRKDEAYRIIRLFI